MRTALVYDGSIRDNGTPYLFRFGFRLHLGYELDWYSQQTEIPKEYDFYIHVDDGRDDLSPELIPQPFGFYCTDSHLGPGPRLEKARRAAITWCAQKPFAEALRAEGLNAIWLPLACSPPHHPTAVELAQECNDALAEKRYDLAFVGHLQDPLQTNRIEFLDTIRRGFPSMRFRFGAFHHDMAREYHSARIGVNHAVRDDLNMRFFELASLGVPQLCDARMVGMDDLGFQPFVHYLPYRSAVEAVEVAKEFLHDPELVTMAEQARCLVRAQHTYEKRAAEMLKDLEAL